MKRTNTIIIGGGQAGLAMSRCLTSRGVEHVVLERGRVAERWRSERWDSLRLLTPRWQSRLPGWSYHGPDADGYMSVPEVVGYLDAYARSFDAPVRTATTVQSVERLGEGFRVVTDRGTWQAANVVIATGQCDKPLVPQAAGGLPEEIEQVVPSGYRNPGQLAKGGVLVVGASSTGVQLADEIHRSGRPVTLAVGRHTRLPRIYRGRDILWWLDAMGIFNERFDRVPDLQASRRQPSLQLVGRPDRRTLDLAVLRKAGVRLVGRLREARGRRVLFESDLSATLAAADEKLRRILGRIDEFVLREGMESEVAPPEPIPAIHAPGAPQSLDLSACGIRTVLWATGYRRSYPWLKVPVLDERGEIRHEGGITPEPGLYVLGLQFLRRRKSSFIDGAGPDAADLAGHILERLAQPRLAVA